METPPKNPSETERRRPARLAHSGLADFELTRELGGGATGTVYLATLRRPFGGLRAGTTVAVKFLHQHLLDDAAARRRFLREARAGMAVRSRNLVRVYAVEETQLLGTRMVFLVMELVDGPTLRELLREGPLAEPLVRSVGAQVARGLAALHESGSAHLDVKPENVVLAQGGRAVVMDLGFVRSLADVTDSERDDHRGFAGSLAYAAPERLRNQAPTPQSDVYSVGVLLYELATGARPFDANDPTAVIRGHLDGAVAPPSSRAPRISPFLDAILLACLEKTPARRIASAEALGEILEQGEASKFWRERLAARSRTAAPGRRPHLTSFHGRDAELRELNANYARVAAGAFRVVDLAGDTGAGKTRLVDEFVSGVSEGEDPPVSLYGRCARVGEAPPADAFAAMLGRYLGVPRGAEPDAGAARRLRELLPPVPTKTLLGFLRGPRSTETIEAFANAFAAFLREAARESPILAFLDDADEADPATARVATSVIEEGPPRVFLVLGRRPVASRIDAPLARARDRRSLVSMALAPLGRAAIAAIVDDLVEPDAQRVDLRDSLVRATAGNPGHVAEVLRSLRSAGSLVAADDSQPSPKLRFAGALEEMPIAPSMAGAILERLRALAPEERRALELLAVAGDRCDPELLASAFGGDPMGWLRVLSRLERPHGLLASAAGGFRFARPMLHEVIYQSLDDATRAEIHGKFAEALARKLGSNPTDRERLRVAEHARRSGNGALALEHLPRLAEDFRRRGLFERALVLARAALDLLNALPRRDPKNLATRFDCLATAAECHSRMGNRRAERITLEKCARIARFLEDPARLARTLVSLGRFSQATGRYLVAGSYLERAIALARETGDARTEAEACVVRATVDQYTGRLEEAGPLLDRALSLAKDRDLRARVLLQQGLRLLNLDRPDLALAQIEEASQLFRELRMPAAQAAAHFHRARAFADFGMRDRARRDLERAVALAREAGERRTEAMSLSLRGAVRAASHDFDGAEQDLRAAAQIAGEIGDRFTECHTALHLANALLSTHNPKKNQKEAARLARLALAIAEELELPRLRALSHAIRARAYLRGSRVAEALRESERAVAVLEEGPRDRRRESAVHFNRGLALRAAGKGDDAKLAFARAAEVIREKAEAIPDEKLRRAFLEGEPFHRKVLAAAGEG